MSTTSVTTWMTDLSQLGPIYPLVGMEGLLWIAGFIFWIGFHIIQVRREKPEFEEMLEQIQSSGEMGKHLG